MSETIPLYAESKDEIIQTSPAHENASIAFVAKYEAMADILKSLGYHKRDGRFVRLKNRDGGATEVKADD